MESILEIRVSHDGSTMQAWDTNGEREIATAKIRTGQAGKTEAEALAQALRTLANRVADSGLFGEGGM
jgi:hypothetical protein